MPDIAVGVFNLLGRQCAFSGVPGTIVVGPNWKSVSESRHQKTDTPVEDGVRILGLEVQSSS